MNVSLYTFGYIRKIRPTLRGCNVHRALKLQTFTMFMSPGSVYRWFLHCIFSLLERWYCQILLQVINLVFSEYSPFKKCDKFLKVVKNIRCLTKTWFNYWFKLYRKQQFEFTHYPRLNYTKQISVTHPVYAIGK